MVLFRRFYYYSIVLLSLICQSDFLFSAWDLTGDWSRDKKNADAWRPFYEQAFGLIFIVDSRDEENISVAAETLAQVFKKYITFLLFFDNTFYIFFLQ